MADQQRLLTIHAYKDNKMTTATAPLPVKTAAAFLGRQSRFITQRTFEMSTVPATLPGPGEMLVRNHRTLVSAGTELALWHGTHAQLGNPANTWAKYPFKPGYAACGIVCAVGAGVTGVKPGNRIMHCGYHADYSTIPTASLWAPVPEQCPDEVAPFARLMVISAAAGVALGRNSTRSLVIGAGLIGLFAAFELQRQGSAVTMVDNDPTRRALAEKCGFTTLRSCTDVPADARPDAIIEATGIALLVNEALNVIARRGTVVLLGSPRKPLEIDIYAKIHATGVHLVGAHGNTVDDDIQRLQLSESLVLLAHGRLPVSTLLTHRILPEQLPEAYAKLSEPTSGWLGVAVDWTKAV